MATLHSFLPGVAQLVVRWLTLDVLVSLSHYDVGVLFGDTAAKLLKHDIHGWIILFQGYLFDDYLWSFDITSWENLLLRHCTFDLRHKQTCFNSQSVTCVDFVQFVRVKVTSPEVKYTFILVDDAMKPIWRMSKLCIGFLMSHILLFFKGL